MTTGTTVQSANAAVAGTIVTATATCPAGKVMLGGGGRIDVSGGALIQSTQLVESYPSGAATWSAKGVVDTTLVGGGAKMTVTAYVVCST